MAICSIQQPFITNIHVKFRIPNFPQSPNIGQNSDRDISNFRISGQSLIKGNYPNPRTSDDIDMKFRPVTKIDKTNKITSKNFDHDVMLINCYVIVIFSIYSQFGAIQKPVSKCIVCKTNIFNKSNLFPFKNWKLS